MTTEQLNQFIKHYIDLDKTKSAIMLTGGWGTGKSHYIKNELVPFLNEKDHKCVIISLYGINNIDDISKSIYWDLRIKKTLTDSEGIQAGLLAAKTVIKGITSYFGIDLSASQDDMINLYQSIDLSKILIIFEDVERSSIDLLDFMGYVNNLVEQDSAKVLLVTNEDEIIKYEPYAEDTENNSSSNHHPTASDRKYIGTTKREYTEITKKYLETKEKTVSDTIIFEGYFHDAINQIITTFEDATLNSFDREMLIKNVISIMILLDHYNLRSFIFACQKTVDIYQSFETTIYCEDFKKSIFLGITFFSCRMKAGKQIAWKGNDIFSFELGHEKYPLFRFCYDYIIHQHFDSSQIPAAAKSLREIRLYDEDKSANDPDISIINNYHTNSEKNLRTALASLEKRLDDPNDISFYEYGNIAVSIIYIKYYLSIEVHTIEDKLINNLKGRHNDLKVEQMFRTVVSDSNEKIKYEYETLRKKMSDSLGMNDLIPDFNYYPEEVHSLYLYVCKNDGVYRMNGTFTENLDITRMRVLFAKCNPEQMNDIRGTFLTVYRPENIGSYLKGDRDAIENLLNGIREDAENDALDIVQKLQYSWFIENLTNILRKLS